MAAPLFNLPSLFIRPNFPPSSQLSLPVSPIVDDIFDDNDDDSATVSNIKNDKEPPKKKYLEEKWKLNSEDQKEFKGFAGGNVDDVVTAEKVPCFALMYKFRKEYLIQV